MQTVERLGLQKMRNRVRAAFHEHPAQTTGEKRRADVGRGDVTVQPTQNDQFIAACGPGTLDAGDDDATDAIVSEPALLALRPPPWIKHHPRRTWTTGATYIQLRIVGKDCSRANKDRINVRAQPVQVVKRA